MSIMESIAFIFKLIFGRRHNSVSKVIEALGKYEKFQSSTSHQLELEESFYNAYRKKASAQLILKMASSGSGPFEAFDIYSRSSVFIICDYQYHIIDVPKRLRRGDVFEFVSVVGGMILLGVSIVSLLAGISVVLELLQTFIGYTKNDFMAIGFNEVVDIFSMSFVGLVLLILAGGCSWMSSRLIVSNRTKAAIKLADIIRDTDFSDVIDNQMAVTEK